MPLAMTGQNAVWDRVYRKLGFDDEDMDRFSRDLLILCGSGPETLMDGAVLFLKVGKIVMKSYRRRY